MQTTDVLISVVIPAYNYAKVLPRAVTSVLAQLDVDCDLMVIDDGSTDETPEVLHQLSQQHPGRFRAVRKANGGLSSVRNLGIAESRGQYLIFLDADDEMAPGALDALRLHIEAHPTTHMVIGGHWSVFENGARALHTARPLPDSPYARVRGYLIDKSVSLSNGACAMHRDVFGPGTYPEHLRNVEDIPVFAQVLARFECTIIDRPLAVIYKHHDSMRHDLKQSLAAGIEMVDEVFSPARLPASLHGLRQAFLTQRCLSLFRDCYGAGDYARAKRLYLQALRYDPCSVRRWSYTRKALRCLFK
ncbi:glycosyltransferase family 2 protein [Pseudomonas alabamensis]|uniref:glycosyltransferase family 2 protein n=1 Tax=Pseudomonas alabamensis TaxID=3064349 RepID=UPI003F651EDB